MKDNCNNQGFATNAIHSGKMKDQYGALTMPIYQTSTFEFESCRQGAMIFAGQEQGYAYSRTGNPTVTSVEKIIATLEQGEAALATSSGMGAISSILLSLLSAGDHIVADKTLYGCTYELLSHHLPRFGIEVTFLDTSDTDSVKKAFKPTTKVVYLETPANPNLKITDLEKVSEVAHKYNPKIKVICDNTFMSPYLQKPLTLGVDIVVHSATKYINGHGDLLAGFVVGSAEDITAARFIGVKDITGSVMAANEAYLIIRGLKTLAVRMERHSQSAMKIALFLQECKQIKKVYYPGLPSHDGYEIAKRHMSNGFGGMIAFELTGGRKAGENLLDSLTLCTRAVSLGDAETLIEHPASMTHSTYSPQQLDEAGIPEGLVRLSVGLEEVEDILADLTQGLEKL